MKFAMVLSIMFFSLLSHAQRHDPRQICLNAVRNYEYYGGYIDPQTWCSDVSSMAEAVCREGGLDYKIRGGDMQVKEWCSDVQSISEAFCRVENLDSKLRTGYPTNVKAHCR